MEDINLPQQSALLPALLLIGVISFASAALGSTHLYLIEQYICHQHYKVYDPRTLQDGGLVDEALCKFPEIQSKVAKISGIYQFLCFVPGLILTGPWGKLARVLGKKQVIFLNLSSSCLGSCYYIAVCYYRNLFDIRFIWLKPLFEIIGGSPITGSSLVLTYVADSVDSKNLSTVLYRLSAVSLCTVFLGLSLSSYLLRADVWLLYLIGLTAYVSTIPITALFPSTPSSDALPNSSTRIDRPSFNSSSTSSSESASLLEHPIERLQTPALHAIFQALKSNYTHNIELFTSIFYTSPLSRLTLLSFFLLRIVANIRIILTQWASLTYHWKIADVHALTSFEMIVSGTILLSLPLFTHKYLFTYLGSSTSVDIFVSKFSLLVLFLGLGLVSVAPNRGCYVLSLTLYTLATPLVDSLRGFSTGLLDENEEVERLYLGIGMVETVGGMVSTALWSGLFSAVVGKGWTVERMPFWTCLVISGGFGFVLNKLGTYGIGRTKEAGGAECGCGEEEV